MARSSVGSALAVAAAMAGLYSVWTLHSIASALDSLVLDSSRRIALDMGSQITFSKVVDGATVTLTVTQQDGESYEDFLARARAEYKAWCEVIGG